MILKVNTYFWESRDEINKSFRHRLAFNWYKHTCTYEKNNHNI